jgi:hypothetical protein
MKKVLEIILVGMGIFTVLAALAIVGIAYAWRLKPNTVPVVQIAGEILE